MDIVESILHIPVQDPPEEEFSSVNLTWTKFGSSDHHDDVALIPYDRADEFIIGECSNVECPTRFHIERGRKRTFGSLKEYKDDEYLEYRLYWCSFGPENYAEGGGILPSRRYRLNTRNRAARPQSMRGCTCNFVVKRLYARPSLALIIYHEKRHVNKAGYVCHGPLDRDAIGPGAKKVPYVCNEIQQQTMSMIYLGIPEENVLEKHIEGIQRYCGSDSRVNDSLASQYVQKLGMIIKRSTHELDLDDQASIRMWVERNKKSIFFYQNSSEIDSFILGIQTEWQLQQMIRFGHCSLIAIDSTFGIHRLKYPLSTLIVFDSRQHALPVAWIITRSYAKPDVSKWMKALIDRARSVEPGWKVGGFLVDDAAAEIDPIRDIFSCSVLFSLWRLRRSWLRNILKRCTCVEVKLKGGYMAGLLIYPHTPSLNLSLSNPVPIRASLKPYHLTISPAVGFLGGLRGWKTRTRDLTVVTRAAPSTSSYIFAFVLPLSLIVITVLTSIRVADKLDRDFLEEVARNEAIREAGEDDDDTDLSLQEPALPRTRNRPKKEV